MPNKIREYLDPLYMNLKNSTPSSGQLSQDLLRKLVGGAAVAALLEGGRRAMDKASPMDEKKHQQAIKDYISTKYISIPSEEEPNIHEELRKQAADGDNDSLLIESGADLYKGLKDILKAMSNPRPPGWYLPASVAALMTGFIGGQKILGSRLDKKEKDSINQDVQDINKNIGRLVQEEYRRTRGEKVAEESPGTFSHIHRFLSTLALVGFLSGTSAGFLKGRSQNPSVIMHKKLTDVIKRNQTVHAAPTVIVPRSLRGEGLASKDNQRPQEHVQIEELNI